MSTSIAVIIVFAIIGILNTLYLSYHAITKSPVKCLFFPEEWCRTVQYSKYSKTFGVPNGFAGFLIYTAILVLTLLFVQGTTSFTPALVFIAIGFLFSMYFFYIQAFILRAFCTWCVLSAIDFTVLIIAVLAR